MKHYELGQQIFGAGIDKSDAQRTAQNWTAGLFVTGLSGGIFGIAGLLLSALSLTGIQGGELIGASKWLLVASLALLGMTSHCLDKRSEVEMAIRTESLRRDREIHGERTRR